MNNQVKTSFVNLILGVFEEDPIKTLRSGLGGEPLNSTN